MLQVGATEGKSEDELEKICEEFKEKVENVRSQVTSKEKQQSGKFNVSKFYLPCVLIYMY